MLVKIIGNYTIKSRKDWIMEKIIEHGILLLSLSNSYNFTPAIKKLHESLEIDYLVWKKYQEKNKISQRLYTRHLVMVKETKSLLLQ